MHLTSLLVKRRVEITNIKKAYIAVSSVIILLGVLYFSLLTPNYIVPILTYHNIGYEKEGHFVSPDNFAKQMEFIKKNGFEVITLDELVSDIKSKKHLKRNKLVITFDDGYQDNFEHAYPVLNKFGFPATVFLVTDYIGVKKGFLSWDEIRVMSRNKISFGGHTANHFYLGLLEDDAIAWEQIAGPKEIIKREIGVPADYFCYPSGGFNDKIKEIVKKAGYKGACSTNRGFAKLNSDVYELKRIKVTNSDTVKPLSFRVKLSGYYNLIRGKKNPY